MKKTEERINWIDSLKALAIFLIVLGHAINGDSILWHYVYGFHVPLFIIIAGMLAKNKEGSFSEFFKNKFKRIMIPYYLWGIISIIIYHFIGEYFDGESKLSLGKCILGLIWGNGETGIMHWNLPLWFLPVFFVLQIITYFTNKKNQSTKSNVIILLIEIIIAIVVYRIKIIYNLPLGIETAIYLMPFMTYGRLLMKILPPIEKRDKKIYKYLLIIFGTIISTGIIMMQKNIDYVSDQYRIYILFFISASLISTSLVLIFKSIREHANIMQIVGQRTMTIMLLHKFPLLFFKGLCPIIKDLYITNKVIVSILISILTVALCLMADKVLKKYVPWAIGTVAK